MFLVFDPRQFSAGLHTGSYLAAVGENPAVWTPFKANALPVTAAWFAAHVESWPYLQGTVLYPVDSPVAPDASAAFRRRLR